MKEEQEFRDDLNGWLIKLKEDDKVVTEQRQLRIFELQVPIILFDKVMGECGRGVL